MNQEIDLNIENYSLKELLNLFKIPMDFDENDLKKAKKIVLQTHPDKSNLSPKYFLFYSKAYKTLFSLWEFKKKGDVNAKNKNTEYSVEENEKKLLLDKYFQKNSVDFNQWFNKEFEKQRIHNEREERGYADWFKSNAVQEQEQEQDQDNEQITSFQEMGKSFERKKEKARSKALIVKQDIEEFNMKNSLGGCDLSIEAPDDYDSGLFCSLPFQDLKKAHEETVIPVTYEDFERKEKFKSVNELMQHRGSQDTRPLSEKQAMEFIENRKRKEGENAVKRSFDLARQAEEIERKKN
jgi:hypothetical protein